MGSSLSPRQMASMLVLLLAVLACATPPSHARAQGGYAAAMRDGFAADAARDDLPRYDLDIAVDPDAQRLAGTMKLRYVNTTGSQLNDLVLRLYPNFPADIFGDGGDVSMAVADISVDGVPASGTLEAQLTALRVPLAEPLVVDDAVELQLSFNASFRPWVEADGTFPLPSYYPMLAAWDGDWRTDVSRFPDRVYAASALYRARLSVPAEWSAIAGGSTIGTTVQDGRNIYEIVSGPIREWAFSVGRFEAARADHAGVDVVVHYRRGAGLGGAAQEMARHIAASIASFDTKFGLYPYRELEFHLINARRGFDAGSEYPGLVYILLNGRYTDDTRYVTAHEVAHQWFYGVVGNDIFEQPWLDEAFAQYSGTLVEEDWAGVDAFQRTFNRQVERLAARTTLPAGLGIQQYGTWSTYYAAVYGRGAQFLHTLRREIGDAAFFGGLQAYYRENKYGTGTSDAVQRAWEQSSGRDLDELFRVWIEP